MVQNSQCGAPPSVFSPHRDGAEQLHTAPYFLQSHCRRGSEADHSRGPKGTGNDRFSHQSFRKPFLREISLVLFSSFFIPFLHHGLEIPFSLSFAHQVVRGAYCKRDLPLKTSSHCFEKPQTSLHSHHKASLPLFVRLIEKAKPPSQWTPFPAPQTRPQP